MPIGLQEIVALLIVLAVVGFALYRRVKRSGKVEKNCCASPQQSGDESVIHFYRRSDDS